MAAQKDISIDQGTDYTVRFKLLNRDLPGYSARMQFRKDYDARVPLLEATTANGKLTIDIDYLPHSIVDLHLEPDDTSSIKFAGDSLDTVYDLELVSPAGDVERMVQGVATISREVTR